MIVSHKPIMIAAAAPLRGQSPDLHQQSHCHELQLPYLSTVRTHNGVKYYARMAVKFFFSGKACWVVGWFGIRGGTVSYWQFRAVFPYL